MALTRTVLEIVTAAWVATGKTGEPTVEFVREWRAKNLAYGRWPLGAQFRSGSVLPVDVVTPLDMATDEFRRTRPDDPFPPTDAEASQAFEALVEGFRCRERSTAPPRTADTESKAG